MSQLSLNQLLKVCLGEYWASQGELRERWRRIEEKAHRQFALSGVLVGAAFGVAKLMAPPLNLLEIGLFVGSLILLVIAIVFASMVLWLRDLLYPPNPDYLADRVENALRVNGGVNEAHINAAFLKVLDGWASQKRQFVDVLEKKARNLRISMVAMTLGFIALWVVIIEQFIKWGFGGQ